MDRLYQRLEVLHRPEFRVDGAVVADGVGRAERALALDRTDRVNGHQPDDIRAQRLDIIKPFGDLIEGALLTEIADKHLIHHHISL